jgi:predicted dehydrogenase
LQTDHITSGLLDFGSGRQLAFTVSTQCCPHQRVTVLGTRGCAEILIPFNAPQGEITRLRIDDGGTLDGSSVTVETLPKADQYQRMAEDFSRSVRGAQELSWSLDDAIAQMAVIDALWRSERSRAWEPV